MNEGIRFPQKRINTIMRADPFSHILQQVLPAGVPEVVRTSLANLSGSKRVDELYSNLAEPGVGRSIPNGLLSQLGISYSVAEPELAHIPTTGATVILANHPHGILDAALLASLLLEIRSDVRFLANPLLAGLEGIQNLIVPIDPFGDPSARHGNSLGIRSALAFLQSGGLLVIFPAGEVSHFDWRTRLVCDPPWHSSIARLLRLAQRRMKDLHVVPAFVSGRNSASFQCVGFIHPRLRTALLLRELLAQRGSQLKVRIGRKTPVATVVAERTDAQVIEYLRWRTDLLGENSRFKPKTRWPLKRQKVQPQEVTTPQPAERMAAEIASLEAAHFLAEAGALRAYVAGAAQIPSVMAEIARLREVTFRSAGEGTGQREDRDEFDEHYQHLFVWHHSNREVVGAYRIRSTQAGVSGLYTATLFRYSERFLERLGPALEMGRSFIRQEYQKDFSPLLLLWKGIGKLVSRNPQYRSLFGPVSISSDYQSASRQIMAAFLRRFAWFDDLALLVASRQPFVPRLQSLAFDVEELSTVLSDIEAKSIGMPVLLRQYLKLGGKLLGFNVDAQFSNVVDGLIVVDLVKAEKKLLERYLGKAEAESFLSFHRDN
ncbi:MAG: lysophospholipid acyltransferase family protein [Bryobacteraceae bacterium]